MTGKVIFRATLFSVLLLPLFGQGQFFWTIKKGLRLQPLDVLACPERLNGSFAASPEASVDRLRRSRFGLPTIWLLTKCSSKALRHYWQATA